MNRKQFFENFRHFEEVIPPAIEKFIEVYPGLVAKIRDAARDNDARALRQYAHSLKSSTSYFCAYPSVKAAQQLEDMGACADFFEAEKAIDKLVNEIDRLHADLSSLISEMKLRA